MLFCTLLFADVPKYDKYKLTAYYSIPWMNNTQKAEVAYDGGKRLKYAFYNATDQVCDLTVVAENTTKYGRTTNLKNKNYQCLHTKIPFEDSSVPFLPNLSDGNWKQMNDTMIHGDKVSHFRIIQDYVANQSNPYNYTEVRTYQQDFYCKVENNECIPVKWYMNSKSNFESHYDIYIIEYSNYNTTVIDSDFAFDSQFYNTTCGAPVDPNDPDGPTRSHAFDFLKKFQKVNKQKLNTVVKSNLQQLDEWRQNEEFTFKVAPNMFIDQKIDEVLKIKTGKSKNLFMKKQNQPAFEETWLNEPLLEELPDNLDWRVKGVLSYAKDQLFCGSCWAFSAIGCVEGRLNLKRLESMKKGEEKTLVQLSEQQIVDCFWVDKKNEENNGFQTSYGCEGGDEDDVLYRWALEKKQVFTTSHQYPYLGQNDYCKNVTGGYDEYKITEWHRVPSNIAQVKRALMSGPIAIGTSVPKTFLYYAGGVYNDKQCGNQISDISHAVVLVGWGQSEYGPYWIVRNSWSPLWGVDGYIYIAMKDNICGITTLASYVNLEVAK